MPPAGRLIRAEIAKGPEGARHMSGMDRDFAGSMPEFYDRYLVPLQFEPFANDMASRVRDLTAGDVLEVAAGTGIVTRALAKALPIAVTITATDLNPAMLEQARSHPGLDRVVWREADAMTLPFPDNAFDAVLCQFGVMFFPDKSTGFREARRVLRPGGRFLFNVWGDLTGTARRLAQETVASCLAREPATLAAPEYNDIDRVTAELSGAGYISVTAEKITKQTRAPSAREAAIANCHGGIMRAKIDEFAPGRLMDITDSVEAAFIARFGDGPIDSPVHAVLFSASRPG